MCKPMLCVTGKEQSVEAFLERVRSLPEADLHEFRLDYLERPSEALPILENRAAGQKILVTVRPRKSGGGFTGAERDRFRLLEKALEAGAWAADVESDAPAELLDGFLHGARDHRVVLSHHIFESGWDLGTLESILRSMDEKPAYALKLAAMTEDTADLAAFTACARSCNSSKVLVLAPMGRAAVAGRVCYRALGSGWTYVAASADQATAPGQLTWDQARTLGMADPGPLLALMGGSQIHNSFGPKVYNPLFRKAGLGHVYLPAETRRFDEALDALMELGLQGAAVTMPHKISACRRAGQLDACARRTKAVNTLVRRGSDWWGGNTDGPAVVSVLSRHGPLAGRTAVLLGTGGAARAAAASLTEAGVKVVVLGRTEANTHALADALQVQTRPWGALGGQPFDLLINATPVGSDGANSPVTDTAALAGKVVMDMVSHPVNTPLLRHAEKAGARAVIPGIEMWIQQGQHQLRLWTGEAFSADEIRKELMPHLTDPHMAGTA